MSNSLTPITSTVRPVRPQDPASVWRSLCWVTDRIAVSGDLPRDPAAALDQLRHWEENGITHEIDVRFEANDGRFVHAHSAISYANFGVDDDGGTRDPEWFDAVVEHALEVLRNDADARIVVHCHLGVNRAPSVVFALMLALGWEALPALRRIRNVRPISGIIYAADAVEWHGLRSGLDDEEIDAAVTQVVAWFARNPLDLSWVIRTLHRRLA